MSAKDWKLTLYRNILMIKFGISATGSFWWCVSSIVLREPKYFSLLQTGRRGTMLSGIAAKPDVRNLGDVGIVAWALSKLR